MKRRTLYSVLLTMCLAIAGCAIPADAPISEPGTVREYFWQPGMGEIHYDVYNGLNTTPVDHTITFTSSGDTIHALDLSNGNKGRISSRVGSDGAILLTEIHSTALFPLPDGAYISKYASEQKNKHYLPLSHFLYFEGGAVAFSGEWPYYSSDRATWTKSTTPLNGEVTAACALSATRLYAGTSTGDLYLSEDAGKRWNLVKSVERPILSIVKDEGIIYFAVAELGVYSAKGGSFARVGKDLPTIAGIAVIPSTQGTVLLAATRDKGLLRIAPGNGNVLWGDHPSQIDDLEMNGVYAEKAQVVVTMVNGDLYTSTDTAHTWQRATTNLAATGDHFTDADVSFERAALSTSKGRILVTVLSNPQAVQVSEIGASIHAISQPKIGECVVASSLGLQKITTNGASEQVGPYEMVTDSSHGEFVLLRSQSGGALLAGDSWQAGNLYLPQAGYFPITARVIEQLDSLSVDDVSFGDVFVVRYAFESSSTEPAPLTPYWMIYFSRGIGPVMLDRIADQSQLTSPMSRAVYKGRR